MFAGLWERLFAKEAHNQGLVSVEPETVLTELARVRLPPQLDAATSLITKVLGGSPDIIRREITVAGARLAVIYIEGLADKSEVERVLNGLLIQRPKVEQVGLDLGSSLKRWREAGLPVGGIRSGSTLEDVAKALLDGETCLMGTGWDEVLILDTTGWEKRAVAEPETEAAVRGPREGFIENLSTNVSLIRRRLRHPNLRLEDYTVGELTRTSVTALYIEGIAREKLVDEVRWRLTRIKIDGILESCYLEELIEDAPFSPFPTILNTEGPDVVCAALLEGRVCILTDGTPFALLVPATFPVYIMTPEDYNQRWPVAVGIRVIRYLGLFIVPSLYVAFTTFHQEMLPTPLAVSLFMQREQVPYPVLVEAVIMQTTFEILTEAGLRLPRPLGQTIGIVGVLVIGEATVRAGLISAAMVIVVSATAIASYTIPVYDMTQAIRILRFPMIFLAATLGLFGILTGLIIIAIHLVSLRSFGVPFLAGFAPFVRRAQRDIIFRAPWWAMQTRPELVASDNRERQGPNLKPKPPESTSSGANETEAEALGGGNPTGTNGRKHR